MVTAVSSASFIVDDILSGSASEGSDTITVTRLVGVVNMFTSSTNEVEYTQEVDLGIGVASKEAFLVGGTALPDPNVAGDYPARGWLYISREVAQQAIPTGGTPTAMYRQNIRFQFDIRTMRKVDKGILYVHIRNTNVDGTATLLQTSGRIRALCMT